MSSRHAAHPVPSTTKRGFSAGVVGPSLGTGRGGTAAAASGSLVSASESSAATAADDAGRSLAGVVPTPLVLGGGRRWAPAAALLPASPANARPWSDDACCPRARDSAAAPRSADAASVGDAPPSETILDRDCDSDPYHFKIAYDKLVIASGAEPLTFNIKGVKENAIFLREVSHAQEIRRKLLTNLMLSENPGSHSSSRSHSCAEGKCIC